MTTTTTRYGSGGGAGQAELFTLDQLVEISQNPDPVANDLAGDRAALIPEMIKGGITTKNQVAAFLANICQETDWLNTLEEYGDEAYFRWGPPDGDGLYLGDEWRYHGRGYIMNTWRDAYQRLSSVLGVDLVSNPDLLAQEGVLVTTVLRCLHSWYRSKVVEARGVVELVQGAQGLLARVPRVEEREKNNEPKRYPAPGEAQGAA